MSGSDTVLHCNYNYFTFPYSVRWYKNGKEFYSYVKDKLEPQSSHLTPGVTVDMSRSGPTLVTLLSVSHLTTGRFRCEVSGQAPMFATDTKYSDMTVVDAPDSGPVITGHMASYNVGQRITANCSLPNSRPAANLTWFINDHMVSKTIIFY